MMTPPTNARRSALSRLILIGFACLLGVASGFAKTNFKKEYKSLFGVMAQGTDGKYHVYAETTQIHRLVDQNYVHGFEVVRKDGSRFMGRFSVRFPTPIKVTPELEKAFTVKEGGLVIESEPKLFWGLFSAPFWFSENDPLGDYALTIYLDGETYRTINYHVEAFGNDAPITF